MLITSTRPSVARPVARKEPDTLSTPVAQNDRWETSKPEPGKIKWGPALAVIGGVGAAGGLAASGLGWASAVPAFLVGGATGFALVSSGVSRLISGQNGDTSATGPISGAAGLIGGVGAGVSAAALALQQGNPLIGLGVGAGIAAVAVGGLLLTSR